MGGSSAPSKPKPVNTAETTRQKARTRANALFDKDVGGQAFTKSLVPGMHNDRTSGYSLIRNNANANSGGNGMSGHYQSVLNNGGYTNDQRQALDQTMGFANGQRYVDTARQNYVADAAKQKSYSENNLSGIADRSAYDGREQYFNGIEGDAHRSYAEDNLSDVASGEYLHRKDPHFEQALARSMSDASNDVNMGAAAAGRYGSAVHQGNVARELGDMSASARLDQYYREREAQMQANSMLDTQRNANLDTRFDVARAREEQYAQSLAQQMQAASLMDAERRAGLGIQLDAANSISANQASDYDRQLAASQQAYIAGQQSLNNMQTAYRGKNAPAQDLIAVGQAFEEQEASRLADERRALHEKQEKQWELVRNMQGAGY